MSNGMNISFQVSALDNFSKTFKDIERSINQVNTAVSQMSLKAQGMAADIASAFKTNRDTMRGFAEQQIEVKHGFLELTRGADQYIGKNTEFMDALTALGKRKKKITDEMMANDQLAKMSFFESVGSILARSTQSEKIADNLRKMGGPLNGVNIGLLKVSNGLENIAKKGAPAVLALKQLGPTANMKDLNDRIRMINQGIMRTGAVALIAAGASLMLYGGLHKAAKAMDPKYASAFSTAIDKIKEAFKPMVQVFSAVMTPIFNFVSKIADMAIKFNEAHPALARVIQGFLMLLPALTLILAPLAVGIGYFGGLQAMFAAIMPVILPVITGLATMMGTVLLVAAAVVGLVVAFKAAYTHIDWFRNAVDGAWAWIKNAFSTALEFIKGIVTTGMSAISSFIGEQLAVIKDWWAENGAAITKVVTIAFAFISGYIQSQMAVIKAVFTVAWNVISGVISAVWGTIKGVVSGGIQMILGIIKTFVSILTGDWKGAWEGVKQTVRGAVDVIKSIIGGMADIGRNIIRGLINGIKDAAGDLLATAKGIADKVTSTIKNALKIKSPSRVMIEVGAFVGEGLSIGISDQVAAIKSASLDMANAAIPDIGNQTPPSYEYDIKQPRQPAQQQPQKITVEVPLYIDGHEIARSTVDDISDLINDKFGLKLRMFGVR